VGFSHWSISSKPTNFKQRTIYGPICFAQTLSHNNKLKLTANWLPLKKLKDHAVTWQFKEQGLENQNNAKLKHYSEEQ